MRLKQIRFRLHAKRNAVHEFQAGLWPALPIFVPTEIRDQSPHARPWSCERRSRLKDATGRPNRNQEEELLGLPTQERMLRLAGDQRP